MSKYVIQKSITRPNGWVLTDKEHEIVVTFDDGEFNDTQKVTLLNNVHYTANEIAHIMQELGEWAVRHCGSKCFKQAYGFEYSEDDSTCCIYSRESPQWRLEIKDNVNKEHLASSLKKAAEWLTKR